MTPAPSSRANIKGNGAKRLGEECSPGRPQTFEGGMKRMNEFEEARQANIDEFYADFGAALGEEKWDKLADECRRAFVHHASIDFSSKKINLLFDDKQTKDLAKRALVQARHVQKEKQKELMETVRVLLERFIERKNNAPK